MLRTIIFYIVLIPATLIYSLKTSFSRTRKAAQRCGSDWGAFVVRTAGLDIEADVSALDPKTDYVFMINHQSNLDIPVVFSMFPGRDIGFVAKKSLFDIPFFGKAMHAAGHVAIDRSNRRRAMRSIQDAADKAREGVNIVIFPEGTRAVDLDGLQDFKIGGMIMALKCGLPVAPIIINGTGDILPKGRAALRPGKVRVKALPPVDTASLYSLKERDAFRDDLQNAMNKAYREMRHG